MLLSCMHKFGDEAWEGIENWEDSREAHNQTSEIHKNKRGTKYIHIFHRGQNFFTHLCVWPVLKWSGTTFSRLEPWVFCRCSFSSRKKLQMVLLNSSNIICTADRYTGNVNRAPDCGGTSVRTANSTGCQGNDEVRITNLHIKNKRGHNHHSPHINLSTRSTQMTVKYALVRSNHQARRRMSDSKINPMLTYIIVWLFWKH